MECYHHEGVEAQFVCVSCGSPLCLECRTYYGDSLCNACAIQRYRKLSFVFEKRSKFMAIAAGITLFLYVILGAFCIRYHLIHLPNEIGSMIDDMLLLAVFPVAIGMGTGGVLFSLVYATADIQRNKFINKVVKAVIFGAFYAPKQIMLHSKNAITIIKLRYQIGHHPSFCDEVHELSI